MDRETWFSLLQLAIVAPYLYVRSEKEKNMYFKLGLKLVAGAILVRELPPLMVKAQPLIQAAAKLQADAVEQMTASNENVIEGDFTETKA